MTKLEKQKYKIDSVDMSSINNKSEEVHVGYYDPSVDPYRKEFVSNNLNIDFNVIICFSVIGAIIIFLFQFCLNNLGIDLKETYRGVSTQDLLLGKYNICQKPIHLIFSFKYPFISIIAIIIIICLIIYLLHLFGIWDKINEYFKEQKYNYDNDKPNIFKSMQNTVDFTKGITKFYDCAIDSVIDTNKINQKYKKKYEKIEKELILLE
tara:strand:- start:564 stop:1187 length:624 start_codon:yes stop_codon:yes gene_type:complete